MYTYEDTFRLWGPRLFCRVSRSPKDVIGGAELESVPCKGTIGWAVLYSNVALVFETNGLQEALPHFLISENKELDLVGRVSVPCAEAGLRDGCHGGALWCVSRLGARPEGVVRAWRQQHFRV